MGRNIVKILLILLAFGGYSAIYSYQEKEEQENNDDLIPKKGEMEGIKDAGVEKEEKRLEDWKKFAEEKEKELEQKIKREQDPAVREQEERMKKELERKQEEEKRKQEEKELQIKVNAAVDKAVAWIKSQQEADGSFSGKAKFISQMKRATTSTVLYALLESGIPTNDPAILKGYDWLRKNALVINNAEKTSTVSAITLALDALVDKTLAESKNKKGTDRSQLIDAMWVRTLHKWLLDNRRRYQSEITLNIKNTGDKKSTPTKFTGAYCTAWPFPLGLGDWNNADTALAVLTLEACSRNNLETTRDVWFEVINHFLVQQEKVEKKGDEVVARGWSLISKQIKEKVFTALEGMGFISLAGMPDITLPYPGSTEAGLESLVICRYELRNDKDYKRGYEEVVEKSIRDGLEYLNQNWPIGKMDNRLDECAYYLTLYGLERVGILGKIKYIGGHDWYMEGSKDLVARQNPAGFWGKPSSGQSSNPIEAMSDPISDTSFAILFLKKATFEMPKESPPIIPEAVPNVSTDVETEYSGSTIIKTESKVEGEKK